ncbi:hypothetical protein AGOR_G00097130 [Albula goreensis]|uniref:alpha-N-acetylgalactosaminide alpha-2,6-sialyltransferase n=1 Tax=Albula goreensis TaxID=1534307 RepID=A0A8T3DNY7_9TELE|nr:hypothetical protein AGOR_G00097130 [Albula goreensis]
MRHRRLQLCICSVSMLTLLGYFILSETEMMYCTRLQSLNHHNLQDNLKKMPSWMFEEVYLQNSQSRETECQKSLRKSENPEFKEAFIPNIQLFLHKGHVNISEWSRLAHFNNPFGFMGYKYTELEEIVNLIPKTRESHFLPVSSAGRKGCIHCAVVANGGILSGSMMGLEIDSHDYVFRMEGAMIEGYEQDVGRRTSVYVHTAQSLMKSLYMFQEWDIRDVPFNEGIRYVLIPVGLWDFHVLKALLLNTSVPGSSEMMPRSYFLGKFDDKRYHVLHPDFLRYIRNRYLKSWHLNAMSWHKFRPTSEVFSLFLALHTCDVVNAYGFLTEDHRKYSENYFKTYESRHRFYQHYDHKVELDLWRRLHNAKLIKLCRRSRCNGKLQHKMIR